MPHQPHVARRAWIFYRSAVPINKKYRSAFIRANLRPENVFLGERCGFARENRFEAQRAVPIKSVVYMPGRVGVCGRLDDGIKKVGSPLRGLTHPTFFLRDLVVIKPLSC